MLATHRIGVLGISLSAILLATGLNRAHAAAGNDEAFAAARGLLQTSTVAYKDGDQDLEGYLAYNPSTAGKHPGVLIVHEWWGLNDYPKRRARELAQLGYVAFAADIYGNGVVTDSADAAGKLAGKFRSNRELMRQRVTAALAVLKANPHVDPTRIVAIGYCFGGTCVLELARGGADIAGVVSFHGALDTPHPEATQKPKAAILACHGGADPYVPPSSVESFRNEMNRCNADWELNTYGEAVHSFTNPHSGNDPSKGMAYNAAADKRSWEDMLRFFNRVLAKPE